MAAMSGTRCRVPMLELTRASCAPQGVRGPGAFGRQSRRRGPDRRNTPMRRRAMLNLAKYAAVAALAGGLGIVATEPASAWGYGYNCGDGCGYGYGAFGPYAYGFRPRVSLDLDRRGARSHRICRDRCEASENEPASISRRKPWDNINASVTPCGSPASTQRLAVDRPFAPHTSRKSARRAARP